MEANALPSVAVLGAGSWGTALAALIARHGHPTVLWGRDADCIQAIDTRHENPRYLPGIPLPASLRATTDLAGSLKDADFELVACVRCGRQSLADHEHLRLYPDPANSQVVAWNIAGEPWPTCRGCGAANWDFVPAPLVGPEWRWAARGE